MPGVETPADAPEKSDGEVGQVSYGFDVNKIVDVRYGGVIIETL